MKLSATVDKHFIRCENQGVQKRGNKTIPDLWGYNRSSLRVLDQNLPQQVSEKGSKSFLELWCHCRYTRLELHWEKVMLKDFVKRLLNFLIVSTSIFWCLHLISFLEHIPKVTNFKFIADQMFNFFRLFFTWRTRPHFAIVETSQLLSACGLKLM